MVILPNLAMAAVYMVSWIQPRFFGDDALQTLVPMALLEFIIIHASALLGAMFMIQMSRRRRVAVLVGLGLVYTLFSGGMSLVLEAWWPVLVFWGLLLNKMLLAILGDGKFDRRAGIVMIGWAMHMLFFIAAVFLAAIAWPQLGMPGSIRIGGEAVENPARVMAGGVIYFTCVSLMYAWGYWATRDPKVREKLVTAFAGKPA